MPVLSIRGGNRYIRNCVYALCSGAEVENRNRNLLTAGIHNPVGRLAVYFVLKSKYFTGVKMYESKWPCKTAFRCFTQIPFI